VPACIASGVAAEKGRKAEAKEETRWFSGKNLGCAWVTDYHA